MAEDIRDRHESLESFLDRLLAEKLGTSIADIRENMGTCSCQWTPEFRARIETVIRIRGGSERDIQLSLDLILGRH